jgi:TRAP transporter TAXI family solute receptor
MQRVSRERRLGEMGHFLLVLALTLPFILKVSVADAETLRFASANPGGAWYTLAVGITEIIKKQNPDFIFSVEPGGGYGATIMVGEKKVNMGFSLGGVAIDAMEGHAPFKEKFPNIRGMVCLYNHYLQGAVLKKSGIVDFRDIKGKTLSSGPKGQISWFWAKRLLEIYGIGEGEVTIRSLDFVASAEAVKDGHIDMMFIGAPMPLGPMLNLSLEKPMRLVRFDESAIDKFCKEVRGFQKVVLPKSKIPYKDTEEDLLTAMTPLVIITSNDEPEELIYKSVKAIAENVNELGNVSRSLKGFQAEDLARDVGVPLHPGALKYYKEVGWR